MLKGMLAAIGTLAIVILIIFLSYVVARYIAQGSIKRSRTRYMKLIDQMPAGQDKSIAIVQVGDRYFLVGIAHQVTMLAEVDEGGLIPLQTEEGMTQMAMPDFKEFIKKMGNTGNNKRRD